VTGFYLFVTVVLLLSILLGLVRVVRGPTPADRMLAAQLFGTTGVAVLLLLGRALAVPAYWDVALVFALLAGITGIAFVRRDGTPATRAEGEGRDVRD
jgi:multicomponent Na+:H+ antiporter subunit F